MNEETSKSLTAFARRLVRPAAAVSAPTTVRPRYPFSDEDMMERYGMRPATPAERAIFPTHPLVIAVIKARIKRIRGVVYPEGNGRDHVVWAVESYPGSHQFRMLNGDLLHEQYHQIEWEPVPLTTPVTTLASLREERHRQQWRRSLPHTLRQSLTL